MRTIDGSHEPQDGNSRWRDVYWAAETRGFTGGESRRTRRYFVGMLLGVAVVMGAAMAIGVH